MDKICLSYGFNLLVVIIDILGRALLMILKWGGELTPAGRQQAEELGKLFRCIYPGGAGEYGSLPGSGFLHLHSTYQHDLKVYASDEGRVQMTAAAFIKVPYTTIVVVYNAYKFQPVISVLIMNFSTCHICKCLYVLGSIRFGG